MTSSKNNVCPKIHGPLQQILPFHFIFFSVKLKKKGGGGKLLSRIEDFYRCMVVSTIKIHLLLFWQYHFKD